MTTIKRTRRSAEFKAKIALEAAKGLRTINELASEYGVHPGQITQWKKTLLEGIKDHFGSGKTKKSDQSQVDTEALYEQIGRLTVENTWLKKKLWSCQ